MLRELDKAAWERAATIACTIAAGSLEKRGGGKWTVADFTPYPREGATPSSGGGGLRICKANKAVVKALFGLDK